MFNFVQETFPVEGPSKEAHLDPTDSGSFRPIQTGVCGVIEPLYSCGERGQTKCRSHTEQRRGKQ